MKVCIIVVATLCIFCGTINAADNCDGGRSKMLNSLKNCKEIEDPEKEKYLVVIEKIYQLCKEGKREEAKEIHQDLKEACLQEAAFENLYRD
ncbi:MAG: hypothetical protein QNI85_15425 [Desulfobacterales bacterium]|nr:hypothetical protein [Desulfobacterales bacterium]